jgi:hypothetical protein
MQSLSEYVSGANDHMEGCPMDNRGFTVLMTLVVVAASVFGIIMHGATL